MSSEITIPDLDSRRRLTWHPVDTSDQNGFRRMSGQHWAIYDSTGWPVCRMNCMGQGGYADAMEIAVAHNRAVGATLRQIVQDRRQLIELGHP